MKKNKKKNKAENNISRSAVVEDWVLADEKVENSEQKDSEATVDTKAETVDVAEIEQTQSKESEDAVRAEETEKTEKTEATETTETTETTEVTEETDETDIAEETEIKKIQNKDLVAHKKATRKSSSGTKKKSGGNKKEKPLTKKQKIIEIIRSLIFSASLGAFVFAGTGLLVIFYGYYSSQNEYSDLQDNVKIETTLAQKETEREAEPETETDEDGNIIAIETQLANLYIPIKVEDDYYKAVNSDYVLYIYIPGTNIQYPVVHGREGGYYLRYTFKGTENTAGAIYLDHRTDKNEYLKSFYTILIGHNRKDGTMFSELTKYATDNFRDEYPYIYLVMDGKEYVYEVFAFYLNEVVGEVYVPDCSYEALMNNVKKKNVLTCDIEVTEKDRILTLYTCNDDSSARYIVHAKLVREY